jgi:hypothetical protein
MHFLDIHRILEKEADLIVPDRGDLSDYPDFQRLCELLGNDFVSELTGNYLDLWSGMRLGTRAIFEDYFLRYDGKFGDNWEVLFVPVLQAIKNGKKVASQKISYHHPQEQTEIETGDPVFNLKRTKQLSDLCHTCYKFWTSYTPLS